MSKSPCLAEWTLCNEIPAPSLLFQAKRILDETDEIQQSKRLWSIYCDILLMRSIYCNKLLISNDGYLFHFILCKHGQSLTNSSALVFDD